MNKFLATIMMCLVLTLGLTACGNKSATPDTAMLMVEDLTDAYDEAYDSYNRNKPFINESNMKKFEEIGKILDEAKPLLGSTRMIIATWKKVGGDKPLALLENEIAVREILTRVAGLMSTFGIVEE